LLSEVLEKLPQPLPWEIVTADVAQRKAGEVTDQAVGLPYGG